MDDKDCVEYDLFGRCVEWKKSKDGDLILEVSQSDKCPVKMFEEAKEKLLRGNVTVRIKQK